MQCVRSDGLPRAHTHARTHIQPNEYGMTNPGSKSSDRCMAIPMGAPDSRIGSERDQIGGRISAARIVDWSSIQK